MKFASKKIQFLCFLALIVGVILAFPGIPIIRVTGIFLAITGLIGMILTESAIKAKRERQRKEAIYAQHLDQWGQEICNLIINRQVALDMTTEMVQLSKGNPNNIDQQTTTKASHKERWVYGIPRQGATYIYFKDDKVTKIQHS